MAFGLVIFRRLAGAPSSCGFGPWGLPWHGDLERAGCCLWSREQQTQDSGENSFSPGPILIQGGEGSEFVFGHCLVVCSQCL